ncbi:MAG: secretin N-terminal domain-containing protein [Rhabdochlamydiaceae bacterium]|nr:secretin N-terminal domain-containing protein [Candidatus Amphrikana amoebophyrae]
MRKVYFYLLLILSPLLNAEESSDLEKHMINFSNVKASELIRFVSKITKSNFIFNDKDLQFEVSFISGKESSDKQILSSMITLLKHHNFNVKGKQGSFVIEKSTEKKTVASAKTTPDKNSKKSEKLVKAITKPPSPNEKFSVYKLQYHQGDEILSAVKQLAANSQRNDPDFGAAVASMQWIKTTNSLVISGTSKTIPKLLSLVKSLDTPQKQVFIEVLVVETDIGKGHEFGLNWSANSQYKNKLGLSMSNQSGAPGFANTMKSIVGAGLQGISHIPGAGFSLGVIGDIITHKGTTFLSLGSLVSAIQTDNATSIVLNQKVIAQDNKTSKIFVGRNIPFAGSVVETVGQSQQTTSNIEYRDIGTSLSITPYIGDNGIITMEIHEEISEAHDRNMIHSKRVSGIETTKTNMQTRVHVPDTHFVVLTGMVRNKKKKNVSGIPCLGGLPWIGAAFSKKEEESEKRNIIIFVRPHILNTFEDYEVITNLETQKAKESQLTEELIQDILIDTKEEPTTEELIEDVLTEASKTPPENQNT